MVQVYEWVGRVSVTPWAARTGDRAKTYPVYTVPTRTRARVLNVCVFAYA